MRLMRAAIGVITLFMLSSCSSDQPVAPSGPVNAQVVLAPGGAADVPAASIRLRFQMVLSDSRCPGDALCIQAGDAVVRIDVLPASGVQATFDLHTPSGQPTVYNGFSISVAELAPYPFVSRPPIKPEDYRVTLRVTR